MKLSLLAVALIAAITISFTTSNSSIFDQSIKKEMPFVISNTDTVIHLSEDELRCRHYVNGSLPGNGFRWIDRTFNFSCYRAGTTVFIDVNALTDFPNRFTILNPGPGDDYNSGWIGIADYNGPWSYYGGLNSNPQYTLSLTVSESGIHTIRVETFTPFASTDNYIMELDCCR